jgi:hypothetical protein
MHKEKEENGMIHIHHSHSTHDGYRREIGIFENGLLDADVFLQVSKLISFHFPVLLMGFLVFREN